MSAVNPSLPIAANANMSIASLNESAVWDILRGDLHAASSTLRAALCLLRNQDSSERYICRPITSVELNENTLSPIFFFSRPFVLVEVTQDDLTEENSTTPVVAILYNLALIHHTIGESSQDPALRRHSFKHAMGLYYHAHLAMSNAENVWSFSHKQNLLLFLAVCNNIAAINFERHEYGEVNRYMDFIISLTFFDDITENLDDEEYDFFFTASLVLRETFRDSLFSMAAAA